jgi:hypothetical protein
VIWWLKARRVHPILTLGLGAFAAVALVVQDSAVLLPALTLSNGNLAQVALFVPMIVVGPLAQVLDNRLLSSEVSGVRRVRWMDTALITVTMAAALAVAGIGGWATGSEGVLTAGRNTCLLAGLMLCARAFVSRSGIVLPLAWIFAVVFFGRKTGTSYYEWAVTALPSGSVLAAVCAAVALVLGLVLTYHSRNPL